VLASAYGFSQREAKTEDDFFLGFPSYWNVVAIYLWQLELAPALSAALVAALAVAVFIPFKYVYPSRTHALWRTTYAGATLWLLALSAAIVWPRSLQEIRLVEITLLYPAYYFAISLWLGGWDRKAPRHAP
jgi:phosphatidylcholine synthase